MSGVLALRGKFSLYRISQGRNPEWSKLEFFSGMLLRSSTRLSRHWRLLSVANANASSNKPGRKSISWLPDDDKTFQHFLPDYRPRVRQSGRPPLAALSVEAAERSEALKSVETRRKTFHVETRGCQMNVADSEVVRALLVEAGYTEAGILEADIVLINTCAIREKVRPERAQFLIGNCFITYFSCPLAHSDCFGF